MPHNPATQAFVGRIKQLISQGKLPDALQQLELFLQNTPLLNEAIKHSARYHKIFREVTMGLMKPEEAHFAENKIVGSVLDLLVAIERQPNSGSLNELCAVIEDELKASDLREEAAKAVTTIQQSKNTLFNNDIKTEVLSVGDTYNYYISPDGVRLTPKADTHNTTKTIKAVNRLTLLRSLPWYRRWSFRWMKEEKRLASALKIQGIFDHSEQHTMLSSIHHWQSLERLDDTGRRLGDLIPSLQKELSSKHLDGSIYLLMGDSGTGKSTALLTLFKKLVSTQQAYGVVLANFSKDTDQLFNIPGAEKTILLLDAIDEASEALLNPDGFFTKVEQASKNFAKVVITCRTQFFQSREHERTHTQTKPQKTYKRTYIDFLNEQAVQRFMENLFRPGQPNYISGIQIVKQTGKLFRRPLILAFISDIVASKEQFLFFTFYSEKDMPVGQITHYELFRIIVDKWIQREAQFVQGVGADYSNVLQEVSLKLAHIIYTEGRQSFLYADIQSLIDKYQWAISETLLRDRSLLRRNDRGFYNFAHRSFKEFFLAELLYQGYIEETDFKFEYYSDTKDIYSSMPAVRYFDRKDKREAQLFEPNQLVFSIVDNLPWPIQVFCHVTRTLPTLAWPLFEGWLLKEMRYADQLYSLMDAAALLVKENRDVLTEAETRSICQKYNLLPGDLLSWFFFNNTSGFTFIHRSFAEFLCLRDLILEDRSPDNIKAIAAFPFDRLRFKRFFKEEMRWLRLIQRCPELIFMADNLEVSREEYNRSGSGDWYSYLTQKANARFPKLHELVADTEKLRIALRTPKNWEMPMLEYLPYAASIQELDIAHNNWEGSIELHDFSSLTQLNIAGNPSLELFPPPKSLTVFPKDRIFPNFIKGQLDLPEMIPIARGGFWMGREGNEEGANVDEMPKHRVVLADFYMASTPVTVSQFAAFVAETRYITLAEREGWSVPAIWKGSTLAFKLGTGIHWRHDAYGDWLSPEKAHHPVVHISWEDAQAYCNWLGRKEKRVCRLPTEAEWEYAAMGGQKGGVKDADGFIQRRTIFAGSDDYSEVAWCWEKFLADGFKGKEISTRPVKSLKPNALGLYDMSGLVWEWCEDWYADDYYASCEDMIENPTGAHEGVWRVVRGGSWNDDARNCAVANRNRNHPCDRDDSLGFRPVFLP